MPRTPGLRTRSQPAIDFLFPGVLPGEGVVMCLGRGPSVLLNLPTDIEIANSVKPRPIIDVAKDLGLGPDDLELYGKYKAKLPLEIATRPARGRLVLVTAINPTPAGEGKSTVSVGLAQALRRANVNAILCMREPSLGPVFGVKGGAAGGGYSQVIPMDDINLHFTGDFHAISSAHALLAAMIDNHLQHANPLGLDPGRITWPRTIDMNDRSLRHAVIGIGPGNGVVREERWVIIPASEVMAIVALATGREDLERRLGQIIIGSTRGESRSAVRARDLRASGAMAMLLKDAICPNLVQTLEGGPALVHAGPFGNIAHGCNSVLATKAGLALGDVVVTEAGFGSDLGAEKFFDIKCRVGGLNPEAAVLVATVRSLKMQGGADKRALGKEDLAALERGLPHLKHHIENVRQFGVPVVVAINRFMADTEAELTRVHDYAAKIGAKVVLCEVWEKGGAGGDALAREVMALLDGKTARYKPLYDTTQPVREKIETIVKKVYGGDGVDFSPAATRAIDYLEAVGLQNTPICMAKTQYSLTDDPSKLGKPTGFRITINEVYGSAGAGFVVAKTGDIMTMPGLPKVPAAEGMAVKGNGEIVGLS
jgi:formate--tetrahydrofolate ligase